jgi:phenylpyruvate tautomerase PptA (4-oxalocrotonate tautomerase family)
MPIVDVEIVTDPGEQFGECLAQQIADAIGDVFESPSQSTWVRLRSLAVSRYAENGGVERGVRPVFVTILKYRRPDEDQIDCEVASIAPRVAELCGRPAENVHILYDSDAAGRIAFGGILRR